MSLIINILGGPGSGKSVLAAELFALLKKKGLSTELVTEFAKEKIWNNESEDLDNQIYIFGNQYYKIQQPIKNNIDIVITDSPLLLSLYYGANRTSQNFKRVVLETHYERPSINIWMKRNEARYEQTGRRETKEQAEKVDEGLSKILKDYGIPYIVHAQDDNLYDLLNKIEVEIEKHVCINTN